MMRQWVAMNIFEEPKIDCHNHVLDPRRFPYAADTAYRPGGQEVGTAAQFREVMDAYGVRNALVVGPNSGYGLDNRALLAAIASGGGRLKGIAVVRNDATLDELATFKAAGIVGVAWNVTLHGIDHYRSAATLLEHLERLDMWVQIQVEGDQIVPLMPMLQRSGAKIVIDHCGRPAPEAGLAQPGFAALLALGRSGRACVKLSGYAKFSREAYPWADARPYVQSLIDTYSPENCVWASDWPFLRATERIDYGPLLTLAQRLLPEPAVRRQILWETPCRLFGFDNK